ncbi:uncharacterized protein LOC133546882 isoform X2 [Nerophis ophidion]|uniref:uncharacterized protein LOC133546882 isoform X2 n=1 Tax=Nerophis ophidion TaxID=159077 RepID=UPI002AE07987|nr:uncharacterized protein LOC133546882 isoform X2 [Nerophis ophidion]
MPRCGLRACETPACHQSATDDQMAHTATWPLLLLWLVCLCCHADGDSTTNYPRPKTVVSPRCENVLENCLSGNLSWTRCYKQHIVRCTLTGRGKPGFIFLEVETSNKVEVRPTADHDVRMPSSALQRAASGERSGRVVVVVVVVVTVLDSKHFQTSRRKRGRRVGATHTVLGDTVLVVQAGSSTLKNLSQPVVMSFKHNNTVREGRCVFWEESAQEEGTGSWSSDGCDTNDTGSHFVCRCNHLSFFAVLVNADVSLSKEDAVNLSLLTMQAAARARRVSSCPPDAGAALPAPGLPGLQPGGPRAGLVVRGPGSPAALGPDGHRHLVGAGGLPPVPAAGAGLQHLHQEIPAQAESAGLGSAHAGLSGLCRLPSLRQVPAAVSRRQQSNFYAADMLDEERVGSHQDGDPGHLGGLPQPGGPLQLLHAGPGALQAAHRRRLAEEGQRWQGPPVEGQRERAGPQLPAGTPLGPAERHLRVAGRHLPLHRPQLDARCLCLLVVFGSHLQVFV